MTIRISEASGAKGGHTCIADVEFRDDYNDPKAHLIPVAVPEEALRSLQPTIQRARDAFRGCDVEFFKEHVRFPLKYVFAGPTWEDKEVFRGAKNLLAHCKKKRYSWQKPEAHSPQARRGSKAGRVLITVGTFGEDEPERVEWELEWKGGRWMLVFQANSEAI